MRRTFEKVSVVFFVILVAILPGCGNTAKEKNPKQNLNFDLPDLSGKTRSLQDFEGKVLVINFWATWCPPCEEEIPKLNSLYQKYKKSDLVVIGIALDKDSLDLVEPFVQKKGIEYPVLRGDQEVLRNLGDFSGVPTTLVVDRKGNIKKTYNGSFDQDDLEKTLKELLY